MSTPPIITSYTAFGRVLALLYAFASVAVPRAKTKTKVRRKPVTREISVPIAIEPVDRARLVPRGRRARLPRRTGCGAYAVSASASSS